VPVETELYDLLGVSPDASEGTVRRHFFRVVEEVTSA
jgi:curved DNA-binding protein CbpA